METNGIKDCLVSVRLEDPVFTEVEDLRLEENRTMSAMTRILIMEALAARKEMRDLRKVRR